MFYWNGTRAPCGSSVGQRRHRAHRTVQRRRSRRPRLAEAVRIVLVTRPRPRCLHVLYNRASSGCGISGRFERVNRYDADDLGLHGVPLLPSAQRVYSDFGGRTLVVPVIHVREEIV